MSFRSINKIKKKLEHATNNINKNTIFFFNFIKFSNMIFFIPLGYSLPARLQSSSLNNSLLIIILKNVKYPEHLKIFWATLYILHLNHVYYGQMKRSAIKIQELFQSPLLQQKKR